MKYIRGLRWNIADLRYILTKGRTTVAKFAKCTSRGAEMVKDAAAEVNEVSAPERFNEVAASAAGVAAVEMD